MKKYLLSTGTSTSKIEYYIIDLFKIYLTVFPKDIPGASGIGIDTSLTNIKKDRLISEIESRIKDFIKKLKNKFSQTLEINIKSLEIIDETSLRLTVDVNNIESEEILINL